MDELRKTVDAKTGPSAKLQQGIKWRAAAIILRLVGKKLDTCLCCSGQGAILHGFLRERVLTEINNTK